MSSSLRPHGLQYTRLPCPSPTPGACSNSCPLSRWCHSTISSSVISFSSFLQSFPASGSFPKSQFFASGGQSIGASASVQFSSIQSVSHVQFFATTWTAAHQASLSITNSPNLLKLMSIKSVIHPTISSSVVPFSSHLQSFLATGSILINQFITSGGQIIAVSASNEYSGLIPLQLTGYNSLQSKGLSRVFTNTTVQKHQFFSAQLSLRSNSHIYMWLLEKPQLWLDGVMLAK